VIFLKAIILALVEGATEFLPVSSTGHLILVERFLKLSPDTDFNNAFMVLIQFPAILSVVLYFWKSISPFVSEPAVRAERVTLWTRMFIALLPAVVLGVLFANKIDKLLFSPLPVTIALIFGGLVLVFMERVFKDFEVHRLEDVSTKRSFLIGLAQCLAMVPGTSRSGASIFGAMLLKVDRKTAAEFSFVLAIPTMAAATGYKLFEHGMGFTGEQWAVLAVGSLVSFLAAYASIVLLMGYIQKHSFAAFGWYRVVLGLVMLVAIWGGAFG
jgi:undecaprenyl-diphosphatase